MTDSRIPLRARDGSIRAWATVSAEDGDLAERRWALGSAGYAQRQVQRGSRDRTRKTIIVTLHRVIAERMGIADAPLTDHRNRDKLDCRRSNLRGADAKLNAENRPKGKGPSPQRFGCIVDGCTERHYAKGKCRRHWFRDYQRAWRRSKAAA